MKVLFYIEPLTERDSPAWKKAWVDFVGQMIISLRTETSEAQFCCVIGDGLEDEAKQRLTDCNVVCIHHTQLVPKFGSSALLAAMKWYRGASAEELQIMGDLVKQRISPFVPDACISFSASPFINAAFPDIPVLHFELGIVSREPFPMTAYLDPLGMFNNSYLLGHQDEIRNYRPTDDERRLVATIRETYLPYISQMNPLADIVKRKLLNYKSSILLALQFSQFYGYDAHADYPDQYDLLIQTLVSVSKDTAVIVVEHPQHPMLSNDTVNYLAGKYENFIWAPEFRSAPSASQYLMEFADCVVTVSSSVGLQTLLWKKRLMVLGHSHLDIIADSHDLTDLRDLLVQPWPEYKEHVLAWQFSRYSIPFSFLFERGVLSERIRCALACAGKDNQYHDYFANPYADIYEINCFYERGEILQTVQFGLESRNAEREHLKTEQNNQIASLNQALSQRDAQIINLNQAIAERDAQIVSLNQIVVERDALHATLAERDAQIASLNQVVVERDALRTTLAEVFSSRSWRITSPIRTLGRLRQLKTVLRMQTAVRSTSLFLKRDGWTNALQKSVLILRREGLRGIKLRLSRGPIGIFPARLRGDANNANDNFANTSFFWDPDRSAYALVNHPTGYTYISPRRLDDLDQIISAMQHRPQFSIIVPVYNTPTELLQKALDSVTSQWYPHWELILVDDASSSEETNRFLAGISDPRVMVLQLSDNKGIAGATNAAIDKASGDFVVFLDHDDELTEDCLFELACCIERENPDYIYSDEDKISPEGWFVQPHFKPDWSPDTMMSTMYTCHVSCVRRSLLEEVGRLRSEYDGCQDWDLVLRLTEKTCRISHIPKVLYHWRIIPASIAADLSAKPYAIEASRKLRIDALNRRGLSGDLEAVEQTPSYFSVKYHLQGRPLISIIIPTRDNYKVLERCLDSILGTSSYPNYEIIMIDNGSVESDTISYLKEIEYAEPRIKVIRHDAPFNFSELNNIGTRAARGEILLFLNDDTEVISSDWLERMGGYAQLPHVGAVGAKLLYPGGREVQHAGILNLADGPGHAFLRQSPDYPGYFMRNLLEYNWFAVTGACLMVSREKFLLVGAFNEALPVAYNDVDLCIRLLEAGSYNVVCQAVRLIHHESASRGLDHLDPQKQIRLKRERRHLYELHPKYFQYDPFHNPNLHPNGIQFELAS